MEGLKVPATENRADHISTSRFSILTPRQWIGIFVLLTGFLVFGVLVEIRSAFLKRRMTDLDIYLRAAWAIRAGADIHSITDENGWHYHYPPLLAIVLTPLADAPPGTDRSGLLPFGLSNAIWYFLNVGLLFWGAHRLATLIEGQLTRGHARLVPG